MRGFKIGDLQLTVQIWDFLGFFDYSSKIGHIVQNDVYSHQICSPKYNQAFNYSNSELLPCSVTFTCTNYQSII